MPSVRASPLPSRPLGIVPERLESCVRRLDPSDRALLDLSLNRGIPDAAMAPILRTDPLRLAWKRARAIERVASRLGMTHPADLALVRSALSDLPSRAWLPLELQPAKQPRALEPPEPAGAEPVVTKPGARAAPAITPPEPAGAGPVVVRARDPEVVRASLRAAGNAMAKPEEPVGEPVARAEQAEPEPTRSTALTPARHEAAPVSTYEATAARPAPHVGRASASTLGGLSERAKRAYPRGAMRTRARRAVRAGAVIAGAAAALAALRR